MLQVTCAAEVPVFRLQSHLLDRIGPSTTFDIVLAAYALRMACYALLPWFKTPWAVLPVETLHGITFACGWGAGTVHARQLAPEGLAATLQVGRDGAGAGRVSGELAAGKARGAGRFHVHTYAE